MSSPWVFGWDHAAAFTNAVAVLIAAWVAKRSVQGWRQERLEARQSDVAEQALILAYQAPEVFARIRSPGGFSGEGSSRKPEPDETPEEKQARDSAFVPIERIANEARFFEQVVEIRPRIDALFGKGQAEPFNEFLRVRWEIINAAHILGELRRRTHFGTQDREERHREETERNERIVWRWPGHDPFDESLTKAVDSIEKLAAPLLESRLRPRKST
jgi:hypothetical protein